MPRAIPPPPLEEARAELAKALAENREAAAHGRPGPYGAGAIQELERRVAAAKREARSRRDPAPRELTSERQRT